MVYNEYTKLRILQLRQKGLHPPAIEQYLWKEEGIRVTSRGVAKFIKRVYERGKQTCCCKLRCLMKVLLVARKGVAERRK